MEMTRTPDIADWLSTRSAGSDVIPDAGLVFPVQIVGCDHAASRPEEVVPNSEQPLDVGPAV